MSVIKRGRQRSAIIMCSRKTFTETLHSNDEKISMSHFDDNYKAFVSFVTAIPFTRLERRDHRLKMSR